MVSFCPKNTAGGRDWDVDASSFELLGGYPKDSRGTPKVDLVSIVWRPAPYSENIPKVVKIFGSFLAFLLDIRLVIRFWKAYVSAVNLSYPKIFLVYPWDAADFW